MRWPYRLQRIVPEALGGACASVNVKSMHLPAALQRGVFDRNGLQKRSTCKSVRNDGPLSHI
jgi:hypothetical protein